MLTVLKCSQHLLQFDINKIENENRECVKDTTTFSKDQKSNKICN